MASDEQMPPPSNQWTYDRAREIIDAQTKAGWCDDHVPSGAMHAFARYIGEHEEAPVDPCFVIARKLVVETQHNWPDSPWHIQEAEETLAGRRDYTLVVKAAAEGVRRGIEIGGSK